jgi:gliding-associated putative ABC transporter substrate-binding component GldG
MQTKSLSSKSGLIVYVLIVLGIVAVVNYAGTAWFSRLDLTESKAYSISPASRKMLKNLDDIINIKVYFSKNLPPNMLRTVNDVKDILAEYKAYGGKKLRITWVDPSESEALKSEARSYGIPEIQLQTYEKDKAQVMNGYLGIAVLFADKKEALPVVQNLQNLEYDLTLAIMKVSRSSVPKVAVLKVDTLPDLPPQYMRQMPPEQQQGKTEVKFGPLFEKLRETYDVSTADVSGGTQIDSTIRTLIVPGSAPLGDRSLFEIDQFFMKGGNLVVLANAMKVDFQYYGPMAVNVESKVLDLVQHYGVKVNQNMVADASCGQVQIPQKVGPFSMNVAVPYPYFVRIGKTGLNSNNPAVAALSEVIMPWPNSLTLLVDQATAPANEKKTDSGTPVKATILASSSAKSWTVQGSIDLNPQQQWRAPSAAAVSASTLAAYLTGRFTSYFADRGVPPVSTDAAPNAADAGRTVVPSNANGRIVVISNSDFVAGQNATPQNLAMILNLVDWLSQDDNLIGIRTRAIKDRTIDADLLKKGSATPGVVRFVNIITMPLLVILAGLFIFYRRREPASPAPAASTSAGSAPATSEEKHS